MAFPTTVRRATAVSATSNSTTWTPSWTWGTNTAISAGERVQWVIVWSSDGTVTTPSNDGTGGWGAFSNTQQGSVTGGLAKVETTGAFSASAMPDLGAFTFSASEQFSAILLAYKVSDGATVGLLEFSSGDITSASGSSTNSDPPSITNGSGASQDVTVVATRTGDSTVVATVAPTNYTDLQTIAAGGTAGASSNTAERQITIASAGTEDPGVFTSASEQWVSYTFGVYEIAAASALAFPPIMPGAAMQPFLAR